MSLLDDVRRQMAEVNDPAYLANLVKSRRQVLMPDFQNLLTGLDAQLNRQGMFSSSPVTTARYNSANQFERGLTQTATDEMSQRWQTLLPVLAQLEQAEQQRKMANKAGWLKFFGGLAGTALPFVLGGPAGGGLAALMKLLQSGSGGSAMGDWNSDGAVYG
jgi:hypothetical protein